MTKLKVGMISLGCNKNRVDSETALGLLREHGYELTNDPAQADVLMVNTCGFIASAKEESIDAILDMARYKQIGKCRVLVVTGCLAQRYEKDLMQEIPEIDLLMGVNQYQQLPDALEKALGGVRKSYCMDDHTYYAHDRVLTTPSYTAYTRIGEGCSNCCTFCAIPKIRGPYRSRPEVDILREIESLAKQGVEGAHPRCAGHVALRHGLRRRIEAGGADAEGGENDGVDWLRVLYCYPEETSEQLLDIIANTPNICSYVDLPIQHVNDAVLKRMHRRGTSADIRRAVKGAHERGITLRTSIIVGFPGETEEQFQELLDFLPEAEFDRLGAFTYSPEEGTPAAKMPDQIPEEVKAERLDRLMKRQAAIARKKNQARVGTVEKVLVTDRNARGEILGRSQREAPETDGEIIFTAGESKMPSVGDFVDVRIEKASTYDLTGVIA